MLTVFVQSCISNSHSPYRPSHRHFHQFLPDEDSIRTPHARVGSAFLPWLEKAERRKSLVKIIAVLLVLTKLVL